MVWSKYCIWYALYNQRLFIEMFEDNQSNNDELMFFFVSNEFHWPKNKLM